MTQPTRWKLASALVAAELYDMADRAVCGFYDDYRSPYDMPISTLVDELRLIGTPEAMWIAKDAMNGVYDASEDEAEAWALSPEGQAAFGALLRKDR